MAQVTKLETYLVTVTEDEVAKHGGRLSAALTTALNEADFGGRRVRTEAPPELSLRNACMVWCLPKGRKPDAS